MAAEGAGRLHSAVLQSLDATRRHIYDFWQQHGPDHQYRGFHGTHSIPGAPVTPSAKGLVQQARHVWAFSTYYLQGYKYSGNKGYTRADAASLRAQRPGSLAHQRLLNSKQMAKTAFRFVVDHMYDPASGMFNWNVTREGLTIQDNKVIYGHWFVLYSFSQYYQAFGDETARDLALQCFRAMDAAWHNTQLGGYDELPENQIPPTPEAAATPVTPSGPAVTPSGGSHLQPQSQGVARLLDSNIARGLSGDAVVTGGDKAGSHEALMGSAQQQQPVRLGGQLERAAAADSSAGMKAEQEVQQVRTLNVAMHGLEALTALHKATQDPVVLQRIHEYLDIICTRLQQNNGLIYEDYIPVASSASQQWQPAPNSVVNYGHNLESTWLVADTLDYLLSTNAIDTNLAQQHRATVMSIGAAAVRDGYDRQHGGIYESGTPQAGPQSMLKVWWIQAEAMLALWKLHQYFEQGEAGSRAAMAVTAPQSGSSYGSYGNERGLEYLQALEATVQFVGKYVTDCRYGEQYWQVQADGAWQPAGDIDKDTKGNRWKASYHDSRSVLFLEDWIRKGTS